MGLSFTIVAEPRQRSYFLVWVPQDSWPYITVSDSRLPQSGGQGPCIYIPQQQGGPVIPRGAGFPFLRLLRLAGLRWSIRTRPGAASTGNTASQQFLSCYRGVFSSPLYRNDIYSVVACVFISTVTCLPCRCLAMNVYSGSVIPVFRRRVTLLYHSTLHNMGYYKRH
jgi:hypothetical protein